MAKTPDDTTETRPPMDVRTIPLAKIIIGEQMIRRDHDDDGIEELALDIAANGLMQPIGVRLTDTDSYQLLWGSRRLRAHRHLHLDTIAAAIYSHDDHTIKGVAVRENILRRQLTLEEECSAVLQLAEGDKLTPEQIACQVGKSRAWVLRRLAVHSLPIDLRELLLDERLSLSTAEALSRVEDPSMRRYITSQSLQSGWTAAEVKHVVATVAAAPTIPEAMEAATQSTGPVQQPTTFLVSCACCQRPRPLNDLAIIRVCIDSCLKALQDPDSISTQEANTDARTSHS